MFSLKAMIAVLVLPLLAVANPISARGGGGSGGYYCCTLTGSTATSCSSSSFLSILNSQCPNNEQAFQCDNTTEGGVGIGCVPVNVAL